MDFIVNPNADFNFQNLTLVQPTTLQGGSFFTKLLNNNRSLFLQTDTCTTKQGIIKSTNKKYYCDLMFDKSNEQLINWFENIEEKCQNLILDKSSEWFEDPIDKNDIENAFNSSIRIFKSGKFYLVRCFIKTSVETKEPNIKIYDENENSVNFTNITNESKIVTILEIKGIKFTSKSFQLEIELKQIMMMNNEPIFNNCLIQRETKSNVNLLNNNVIDNDNENVIISNTIVTESNNTDVNVNHDTPLDDIANSSLQLQVSEKNSANDLGDNSISNNNINLGTYTSNDSNFHSNENLDNDLFDNSDNLSEFSLDVNNIPEDHFTLKEPDAIYKRLYLEALEKANQAKKDAIKSYLEAKNIKSAYLHDFDFGLSIENLDKEINELNEQINI